MLKFFKNNRGVTLVEVLVSAGMTAIVSMGVATMMQNSMQEQRKVVMMDFLKSQKSKFEFLIRDQASWTNTVGSVTYNNLGIFNEIRANSSVTVVPSTAPVKIVLLDAAGSPSGTQMLGPAETTGNGFTEKGVQCSTFNLAAGSGTDACPISYRTMISATCPSGGSCANPQLKVVARLLYNPASTGTLNSFRSLISTVSPTTSIDISDTVNDGKYDAVVKRTSASVNRSFRVVVKWTPAAGGCASAGLGGAGQCSSAGSVVHPATTVDNSLGLGLQKDYDPNNLVTLGNTAGTWGEIKFNETGYYGCMISVPAFATGGFTAFLHTGATDVAYGSTTAGQWAQSSAIIDTKFNVTSTSAAYKIYEKCDNNQASSGAAYCTLGMGASPYGGTPVLISMSCYKLDRSM